VWERGWLRAVFPYVSIGPLIAGCEEIGLRPLWRGQNAIQSWDPFLWGSCNRSASREVDRFVYRLTPATPPAAASWRGFGALAFVERAQWGTTGPDPNGGETGETPP